MRSLSTDILLTGSGTVQLYDYELDALREIADVQILQTDDIEIGGHRVHRHIVHYVVLHPVVRPYLPPPAPPHRINGRDPFALLPP